MIKKFLIKAGAALILITGLQSSANAGSAPSGLVSTIVLQTNGQMFFNISTAHQSRPSCALSDRWVIDTSKLGGQAAAQTILTAFSMRRPLSVQGTGACEVWGDTETVAYFTLLN